MFSPHILLLLSNSIDVINTLYPLSTPYLCIKSKHIRFHTVRDCRMRSVWLTDVWVFNQEKSASLQIRSSVQF